MRFDLLDEYSTLVPFGLGGSRNRTPQEPVVVPSKADKRGTIPSFISRMFRDLRIKFGLRNPTKNTPLLAQRSLSCRQETGDARCRVIS